MSTRTPSGSSLTRAGSFPRFEPAAEPALEASRAGPASSAGRPAGACMARRCCRLPGPRAAARADARRRRLRCAASPLRRCGSGACADAGAAVAARAIPGWLPLPLPWYLFESIGGGTCLAVQVCAVRSRGRAPATGWHLVSLSCHRGAARRTRAGFRRPHAQGVSERAVPIAIHRDSSRCSAARAARSRGAGAVRGNSQQAAAQE